MTEINTDWKKAALEAVDLLNKLNADLERIKGDRDGWYEDCKKLQPGAPVWKQLAGYQTEIEQCRAEIRKLKKEKANFEYWTLGLVMSWFFYLGFQYYKTLFGLWHGTFQMI